MGDCRGRWLPGFREELTGGARSGREYGFPLPPVKQSFPATLSQQGAPLPDVELTPSPRTGSNCLNHPWSSGPATLH